MNKEEIRQQIIKTANRRYATKKYDPSKHLSDEDWQTILEAGRLSPSSNGLEPWKFVLINNDQMKQEIKPFSWGAVNSINGADKLLMILARTDVTYDSDYVKHIVEDVKHHQYDPQSKWLQRFKSFINDDMAISNRRELFDWAAKQAYIPLANMMTAAAELGIDSCPIEGFSYPQMTDYLSSHRLVDTKYWEPAVMVSFGYRDQPIKPKVRQSLNDIYEEWN